VNEDFQISVLRLFSHFLPLTLTLSHRGEREV